MLDHRLNKVYKKQKIFVKLNKIYYNKYKEINNIAKLDMNFISSQIKQILLMRIRKLYYLR